MLDLNRSRHEWPDRELRTHNQISIYYRRKSPTETLNHRKVHLYLRASSVLVGILVGVGYWSLQTRCT